MPLRNPYENAGAADQDAPSLTELPSYMVWAVVGFIKCWVRTRRIGLLLQGVPAIVLGVLLASLLISSDQPVASATLESYLTRADQAMTQEDFEKAEFYFRKLNQLDPDDPEVIDRHAELHAQQGDYREAMRLKERLVSDHLQSNDAEVHRWLAKTALEQDVGLASPMDYAKGHLVAVLDENPDDLQAHYFFARLHLMQRDIPNAVAHLQPIAMYSSAIQLQLASLYLQLDPPDRARSQSLARSAAGILKKKIQETQTSDASVYHQLAAACVMLDDFEDAIQTLREAATRFNLEATRRQIARVYVSWSDHIGRQDANVMSQRIPLLEKALETAPNEPLVLQRMLEIASAEGAGAERAEEVLRQALVDGIAPAAVHFSLGALAAKRGDTEAALRHFHQSEELNPQTAVTLNNIAYLMAQASDADLQQALELANQAVNMAPGAAAFRDTRGQILTRLERWKDAITDLEYANSRMSELAAKVGIHRSLAAAYRGLGDETMAEAYQEKFEKLSAQLREQTSSQRNSFTTPELDLKDDEAAASQDPAATP